MGFLTYDGRGDTVQSSMRLEGIENINVTTMGGDMVLLQS